MEGDVNMVAEFFFLVAVDHHQTVAEAIRQVTTLRLSWIPLPVDKTFVNRDAGLKDSEETRSTKE